MTKDFMDVPFDAETKETPYMTLAEGDTKYAWANLRQHTLNGKDAGVLLGHVPWRTREELLAEKWKFVTFRVETGTKDKLRMDRGRDLQEEVANVFAQKTGEPLQEGGIYKDKTDEFMVARISHMTQDGEPVLIVSTSHANGRFWEMPDGSPKAPDYIRDECQWNMAVTGTRSAYVACLVDNLDDKGEPIPGVEQKMFAMKIDRDKGIINQLRKEARSFNKEFTRDYLVMNIAEDMAEKVGQTFQIKMPEGSCLEGHTVTFPERVVKSRGTGKGYDLVIPKRNQWGQSYTYRKEDGKSTTSAEVFCAVNKVRGNVLFVNNRKMLRDYRNKKKEQTKDNPNGKDLLEAHLGEQLNY